MNNAMGNEYGINLGNIMAANRAQKESDQRFEMNAMQMDSMRSSAEAQKQKKGFMQSFIDAKTPEDRRAAFNGFVTLDADEAVNFVSAFDKMDERDRLAVKRQNARIGKLAWVISQSPNPEKAWEEKKRYLTQEEQNAMGEYSPTKLEWFMARPRETEELMSLSDNQMLKGLDYQFKTDDREDRQEFEREMQKLKDKAAMARKRLEGKEGGGIKASDVNAMYKQVASLYGGFYDPGTGEFSGLDPDKALKVQGIITQAEKNAIGGMGLSQAVTQAARQSGLDIPGAQGVQNPPQTQAPPAALEYLQANPDQIDAFEAKYGYRPAGF